LHSRIEKGGPVTAPNDLERNGEVSKRKSCVGQTHHGPRETELKISGENKEPTKKGRKKNW